MDYEKKYKNALEWARQVMNGETGFIRKEVEEVFPELKESEDERIKEKIIATIHLYYGEPLEDEAKEMIAWLEKQAEQKPAWSEEDERMCTKTIFALAGFMGNEDKIDWLKSIKDRVLPQPKQEWSQNDIDMIDWLIRCCEKEHEELCNDKYGHQDIVSDLKRDCRKKWNWLESLKNKVVPQNRWKPSDEQMVALKHAFNDGSIAFADMKILATLYEQLKALHRYEQDT